ncbi:DUF2247 family protein [Halalkalibacter sp. APA_J-10(15)]|uniref:DUF2247 family protein n=1 Tax=Halalkalibacter sp. APA_J-10(15) TaxID=2933805 RepID=UPI001FF64C1C|nr:DUF2247 family protein [Halalkalibacter sp. APA_J-10(15)]MCK0473701.1 DUF2247 family protein [Halalkalibacter sp. APA_J-10(15)]
MSFSKDTFKEMNISCGWYTLYVGLNLGLISESDIMNYAIDYLSKYPNSENHNIIQLAWGDETNYWEILINIVKESSNSDLSTDSDTWQLEKRKWRLVILVDLQKKYLDNYEELLNKVAKVYADMDYPVDMEHFINYLTPKDGYNPSLYSPEENRARLVKLFNSFLDREKQLLNETT